MIKKIYTEKLNKKVAVIFALLAAALYAINIPISKHMLGNVSPTMLAGFLYVGAGVGMGIIMLAKKFMKIQPMDKLLDSSDVIYAVLMVVLDIAAPILLMLGIAKTNSANASLLNNFEIVATSIVALIFFKEKISRRLWGAILLVIAAGVVLGFERNAVLVFNEGSLYVLGACICWGIENNCTRSISDKSSEQIVVIKGIFSGIGSSIVALAVGEKFPDVFNILAAMFLGFVAYGLSIKFYIIAQSALGAAKTSAFYSIAPFFGVGFSFIILGESPALQFYVGLLIMLLATIVMVRDTLKSK